MQLSAHFTLREFTRSQTAERLGIDNTPPPEVVENLRVLCAEILEPLRIAVGPITVTSGYRCPELNKRIGGSATGQHPLGQAADIECFRISTRQLAEAVIRCNLRFDQLILEGAKDNDPSAGWVHVSYRKDGKNRGQVLTATFTNGKATYRPGLFP